MTNQTIEEAVEELSKDWLFAGDEPKEDDFGIHKEFKDFLRQALQATIDTALEGERKKIGAMIEEADYARKVGEKTGDPIAVWEVQDVIRQILALTPPTK